LLAEWVEERDGGKQVWEPIKVKSQQKRCDIRMSCIVDNAGAKFLQGKRMNGKEEEKSS